jgi:hypothetical protein
MGLAFGALDQYVGSLSPVGAGLSNLSAPWLLLAFFVGVWQRDRVTAAWLGLLTLVAAVTGFVLMIASPFEGGGALTPIETLRVAHSQWEWFLASLVAGPIYGMLGNLWRDRRAIVAAAMAGCVLLLEPLVRLTGIRNGRLVESATVIEIAVGVAVALYFAVALLAAPPRRTAP